MVSWRTNYDNFEENNQEMKKHVDEMYKLVNNYANKNRITLAYDDTAERFVEAIATYIVNSQEREYLNAANLMEQTLDYKICPKCKYKKLNPIPVRNALSRRDNKTYICTDCGMQEAIDDLSKRFEGEK